MFYLTISPLFPKITSMRKRHPVQFLLLVLLGGVIPLLVLGRFRATPQKFSTPVIGFDQPQQYSQILQEERVQSARIWLPEEEQVFESAIDKPIVDSQSALSFDLSTNQFLYQKDIKTKRPIASLVKIMTAIIALERADLGDVFTVDLFSEEVGEDSMGLSEGERYTLEELLYGMFLPSGNDAAEAIACNISKNREEFIDLMNNKALEIGLFDTHFVNPTGLEEEELDYSTAYDVLIMTRYAIATHPVLKEITATKYYEIYYSEDHKYIFLENDTNLLGQYPGVYGFKTGYTPAAGLCLVSLAKTGGHDVAVIILDSRDRREDATLILDYTFNSQNIPINP